jgi:hypothetical protein
VVPDQDDNAQWMFNLYDAAHEGMSSFFRLSFGISDKHLERQPDGATHQPGVIAQTDGQAGKSINTNSFR